MSLRVIYEEKAIDQAAGFLADDPVGLGAVLDAVDRLAGEPRPAESFPLGLVLNCVVLWTTVYLDAAVRQLRVQGYPVREEDMARLSPFVSRHLGVHGTYSFVLPDLAPGAIRELRVADVGDEDHE